MKVKELMEALSYCPQDAEVFSYNSMCGDDMVVRSVSTHLPQGNYDFPYGCQGDSWLEEHFMENGPQPVVFFTDNEDKEGMLINDKTLFTRSNLQSR